MVKHLEKISNPHPWGSPTFFFPSTIPPKSEIKNKKLGM
jgi:hypothetical protein